MMIIRLKFKYKYLYAVILLIVIFFLILVVTRMRWSGCSRNEPIDVVYTWVNGSDEMFLKALSDYLLTNEKLKTDVSVSRFTDRYELKFSLRSLEMYAPWIRNVYIVTNGQIPYWLNLDYERVFVVTHEEIFSNSLDLPTFSSPAIETHLHKIPGISRRFLYFNDDVHLGAPVYPEDFLSPSRGFLIYFNHPLQSCAKDCPWLYVHDGQCDRECYNFNCQMDGGDCGPHANSSSSGERRTLDSPERNRRDFIPPEVTEGGVANLTGRQTNDTRFKAFFTSLSGVRGSDIGSVVDEHNKKVLLRNKLKRKRLIGKAGGAWRYFRFKMADGSFNAYMESLQHTNRLFNAKYGFAPRHVPAHVPFLVDADVVSAMQLRFKDEVAVTSANRVRSGNDLQFAFGYYHYIYHERVEVSVEEIFDRFDTDGTGTWSDREIRTVMTKLYKVPLNYADVDEFDSILISCWKTGAHVEVTTPLFERYVDSKLPTVSKGVVCGCANLTALLTARFGWRPKYRFDVVADVGKYASFHMLTGNAPDTIKKLDGLRRNPTKFVCLNDNVGNESAAVVNALWYDFYVSLFPKPSRFELPAEYRNKFLHVSELRRYHFQLKLYVYCCVVLLTYATACLMCSRRKIACSIRNKFR